MVEVGVAGEEGECKEVGCIANFSYTVVTLGCSFLIGVPSRLVRRRRRGRRRRLAPTWRLPALWRWLPWQPTTAVLLLLTPWTAPLQNILYTNPTLIRIMFTYV